MGEVKSDKTELEARIQALEQELAELKTQVKHLENGAPTVRVPENMRPIFEQAQTTVRDYFKQLSFVPSRGLIEVNQERYVLIRASSLSFDFFKHIQELYGERDPAEAFRAGQDYLFDIGHALGLEDAKCFHQKMNLHNPVEKLSAGPVHFAYSGWAFVDILPESHPVPTYEFFIKYHHPYSFEADSWLAKGVQSKDAVCIMNAAYSAGWCEASFGIPLTAVEISCRAKGDENCTFIMAPPHRIQDYLPQPENVRVPALDSPIFFDRKVSEATIKAALKEKEVMLQEIHHRVKNNLQIIVSLMGLQLNHLKDPQAIEAIRYTQNRIGSIAMIHEMLYESKDLSQIHYQKYITRLVQHIFYSMNIQQIQLSLEMSEIYFEVDTAIPLGLILNELVTNSCKHGFETDSKGEIVIRIRELSPRQYQLIYADTGKGFPPNFQAENLRSLGLKLIHNLVRQLEGQMQVPTSTASQFSIIFQKPESKFS